MAVSEVEAMPPPKAPHPVCRDIEFAVTVDEINVIAAPALWIPAPNGSPPSDVI
jgi:hypothetical protein